MCALKLMGIMAGEGEIKTIGLIRKRTHLFCEVFFLNNELLIICRL